MSIVRWSERIEKVPARSGWMSPTRTEPHFADWPGTSRPAMPETGQHHTAFSFPENKILYVSY
jgi:hypothetical protein